MDNNDAVFHLTSENFQDTVNKGVVLVDFWAPWCGPCRMQGPIIEKLAEDYKGKAVVAKLNTDENQETAINLRVTSIPTLMLYKDGTMVERRVGLQSADALEEWLDENL